MSLAFDDEWHFFFRDEQCVILDAVPRWVFDAVKINNPVAGLNAGYIGGSGRFYKPDNRRRIGRYAVDEGHRKRDREGEHDIHKRPAEHHQKFLPTWPQLVKLGIRNDLGRLSFFRSPLAKVSFVQRFLDILFGAPAFERRRCFIAVKFDIRSERDRRDAIVRVADLDTKNSRPEAE